MQAGTDIRFGEWSAKDIEIINVNCYNLLTAKPVVYLVNLSEVGAKKLAETGRKLRCKCAAMQLCRLAKLGWGQDQWARGGGEIPATGGNIVGRSWQFIIGCIISF